MRPVSRQRDLSPRTPQAGKMLVPLLITLTILALGVMAVAIFLQMQEREKREAKQRELRMALIENSDLKTRVDELQQVKSRLEEDLGRAKKDLAESQGKLTKSLEAQEALSKSVEDREREIVRVTKDLEQVRNDSRQLSTQISELTAQRDTVKQQLADLQRAKDELDTKLSNLAKQPTVELEKVMVTNEPMATQPPLGAPAASAVVPVTTTASTSAASEGQIVVVNRDYDFIVMNMGKNQGLSIGQEFQIVRSGQVLGKVKVEKVYDELSAAAILPDSQKDNIREGDSVRAL